MKATEVLAQRGGITVTPGGLVQACQRLAQDGLPADAGLREQIRRSPMVSPDETGWRIGGHHAWLWTVATPDTTVYRIAASRGTDVARELLGEDYAGIVVRDGWAPYRQLTRAEHRTCLAHLLRRCDEILAPAHGRAREIPRAVRAILHDALEVRRHRDDGDWHDRRVARELGRLEARMDALLERPRITRPDNRRLRGHLRTERGALFTFLKQAGVDATNWRAEQAIRPAVVNRKVWGGNRTPRGARTQEVLTTLMQTCRLRGVSVLDYIA
ncbi:MAG: IS66 family transposase, partial [Trebonia sp.]